MLVMNLNSCIQLAAVIMQQHYFVLSQKESTLQVTNKRL